MNGNKVNLKNLDIFSHLVSFKYLPRWVVLFIDITIVIVAYIVSNKIAVEFFSKYAPAHVMPLYYRLLVVSFTQLIFFWLFHTYSGVLRYSGYVDLIKLILAVFANVILLILLNFLFCSYSDFCFFYNATLILYGFLAFVPLFIVRLTVKTFFDYMSQSKGNIIPVMIYGTLQPAVGIAKMLNSQQGETKYKLVGFLDNDKNATEKLIMGVKVYFLSEENIKKYVLRKARTIIVSPKKMEEINAETDLDIFLKYNISILTLPPMSVWKGDEPSIRQIKSVQIEDLLDRPVINIPNENLARELEQKVILVTGAAGSIGSEIANQVIQYKPKLIVLLDQAETPLHNLRLELQEKYPDLNFSAFIGNIRNQERMDYMMDLYRPDFIFHAAAYKHVPLMEEYPIESVETNVEGTKVLADLAVKYKVQRFVMISTDKAVNPTNIMGASKRIAEIYVQSLNNKLAAQGDDKTKFITTRFGNVLGSNGSVIPLFRSQIEKGGPITVTHPDIIRYFMIIPEACRLVLEACIMGNGGEIYLFDMGKPVKIVNLARKMILLAGLIPDKDIKIEFTGLRPGEKLYEELLNNKEITTETHNPKITIAKVQQYDYEEISKQIKELLRFCRLNKSYTTVSIMKKIVPEFVSKNSQYERLDV